MGKRRRESPRKLARKLEQTREHLSVTQEEMLVILFPGVPTARSYITDYESGKREPPMPALVRLVKHLRRELKIEIYVDHFVDDTLKLPFP